MHFPFSLFLQKKRSSWEIWSSAHNSGTAGLQKLLSESQGRLSYHAVAHEQPQGSDTILWMNIKMPVVQQSLRAAKWDHPITQLLCRGRPRWDRSGAKTWSHGVGVERLQILKWCWRSFGAPWWTKCSRRGRGGNQSEERWIMELKVGLLVQKGDCYKL